MKHTRRLRALVFGLVLVSPGRAQVTQRVSVSTTGHQTDDYSTFAAISADGRTVVFDSFATNLVAGDSNGDTDVFCHGRLSGQTTMLSLDAGSTIGNANSYQPSVSADGRYVAFHSEATNLVPGDTNGQTDVFVRDRALGTIQRISISSTGAQSDDDSYAPSISADGRFVAFHSYATNLVSGDTNAVADVFVRDRLAAVTERVSLSSSEVAGNGSSLEPSISADGRYVAFESDAANLVSGDTAGFRDIFVRDRLNGTTVRTSVNNGNTQANGTCRYAAISADGGCVAFQSVATNLIGPLAFDTNGFEDIFCRDYVNGGMGRVSITWDQQQSNEASGRPSISADGRFVAFHSRASNLVAGDTNADYDIFVRDRVGIATERVSRATGGTQGNDTSQLPTISDDGRFVAFVSDSTNLVPGDTNDTWDVFVHDRNASGFTSTCHPGIGGVIGCPCGNPPGTVGRGCDNSSGTGGAFLSASGLAYLATDSLLLTTFAERPTALSIVLQGTATIPVGVVYGQGVRCVGGSLVRLYTKNAASGSITVPGPGDPSVSARSAAKGDTIQPGQTRWYLVYYRDGNVLGGCPSTSKFNATQTGRITWMP